ncbi:MAG: SWIM zinc finger family protein [Desulfuromonadales bacterium]
MGWDDFRYYPKTTPRAVTGGIKAQKQRGAFAGKWWGKRWLETLESFPIGARLSRGRSYARSGQVTDLEIGKGALTARVQGSRKTPYRVTIKLKAFAAPEWQTILLRFASEPILAARLLGNELPEELETVFKQAGLPLFPEKQNDLVTDCSCPDWSNPCKHVAAVYYLLAEAFDNDPFLLFKLRGMERDEFFIQLREAGGGAAGSSATAAEAEPVPLPEAGNAFWAGTPLEVDVWRPSPPTLHAALPKRLGPLPFWRGGPSLIESMSSIYRCASEAALEYFSRLEEGNFAIHDDQQQVVAAPANKASQDVAAASPKKRLSIAKLQAARAHRGQAALPEEAAGGQAALPAASQPVPGGIPARLLAALRLGRTYNRAELLAATGILAADWSWAIRQLKEEGLVVQEGEKRGARYRRR